MDPFLTIYRKDFARKKVPERRQPNGPPQEFYDPLMESFKNYLQLSSKPEPPNPPSEDCDGYLEKIKGKYTKVAGIHFKDPVDNAIMTRAFIDNGKSIYQCDYCDLEKDEAYKEMLRIKNLFRLPNDIVLPLTTQTYSYRNPLVINSRALQRTPQIRVPNNLEPQHHIRKILKVTTGVTEYAGKIGEMGELIMDEHLHGTITHPKCYCTEHHPEEA